MSERAVVGPQQQLFA